MATLVENSDGQLQFGENGSVEYTQDGVGDPRVALFAATVRDTPFERIRDLVQSILKLAADKNDAGMILDLIVLAFQARHCRGGKGERRVFFWMLMELARAGYLQTVRELVVLLPHFGYWKDLFLLLETAAHGSVAPPQAAATGGANTPQGNASARGRFGRGGRGGRFGRGRGRATGRRGSAAPQPSATPLPADVVEALSGTVTEVVCRQLERDMQTLEEQPGAQGQGNTQLSLLAKYLPREGQRFDRRLPGIVKRIAGAVFPDEAHPLPAYRRAVSRLNDRLRTTECLMCAQRWEEVEYGRVASLCMLRNLKVFLEHDESGALRKAALTNRLKGKQAAPHEIVTRVMKLPRGSSSLRGKSLLEAEVLNAQWQSMRSGVKEQIEAQRERHAKQLADVQPGQPMATSQGAQPGPEQRQSDFGKLVPLVDVSGSMNGVPMVVAVALGILTSELTHGAFRDEIVTFESNPRWVRLSSNARIDEKVRECQRAPWGGSTDFEKALELILARCVEQRLAPEDVPDLIVFSDMQFDQANWSGGGYGNYMYGARSQTTDSWQTSYERLALKFHDAGVKAVGQPYPVPTVTFWNLRGSTTGFVAKDDTPGVRMLSGFSGSQLKLLVEGEEDEGADEEGAVIVSEVSADGENIKKAKASRPRVNPYKTMRKAIDDPCFDIVRVVAVAAEEGALGSLAGTVGDAEYRTRLLEYFHSSPEGRQAQEVADTATGAAVESADEPTAASAE